MSSNLNTVLADCEKNAEALIEEIGTYRTARVISEQSADSLEKLCVALQETHERIQPFTSIVSRRILIVLGVGFVANIILLLSILVLLLNK
jgi:hypothetical protein